MKFVLERLDAPSAFGGDDQVVGGREEPIDAAVHEALQHFLAGMVVGHERRVRIGGRAWRTLNGADQIAIGVHRMQAGEIARRVVGQPHETIGHKCGAGSKRILGKELEQVGEPANRVVPPRRRREGRAVIRRRDQHCASQLEATRDLTKLLAALDEIAKHQPAA
jgi:hypothetical protein